MPVTMPVPDEAMEIDSPAESIEEDKPKDTKLQNGVHVPSQASTKIKVYLTADGVKPVKRVNLGNLLPLTHTVKKQFEEENAGHVKDLKNIATNVTSTVQEAEEVSKSIMTFIDSKNFLFKTSLTNLRIHPQFSQNKENVEDATSDSASDSEPKRTEGLEIVDVVSRSKKKDLPPAGEFKRRDLILGDKVWVMKATLLSVWVKGTVLSVRDMTPEKLYKLRFESNKCIAPKLYTAKQLAYDTPADVILPVGTRIVARYTDSTKSSMYAGTVAEPPKITNGDRYLVFFDDGYAQYMDHSDIYAVCAQSIDVADDVHETLKDYVRKYLLKYPERAMVKLQKNQITKTELMCQWCDTKVLEVDSSMVKMLFLDSQKTEWIYRGSTRLQLLYNELANAEAHRQTGKHRRHNIVPRKPHQPYVEYTRGEEIVTIDSDESEDESKESSSSGRLNHPRRKTGGSQYLTGEGKQIRNTARKSTAAHHNATDGSKTKNVVLPHTPDIKSHLGYTDIHQMVSFERIKYTSHDCSIRCREKDDPARLKGRNPLLIPIFSGWERQVRKCRKNGARIVVLYRAPCGRHLRNLQEIQDYLYLVSSRITIDFFSLDSNVVVFRTFRPKEILYKNDDVTQGKENVPVSCVNSLNPSEPPFVEYAAERFPGQGVYLNLDENFMCGCSCTDNCQNPAKCECQQLTNFAKSGRITGDAGYKFRRLNEPLLTGIYECNSWCKCNAQCGNRVVQNGLQVRLQMFKTQFKGWGIRCLDDIDAGMFICIYAGQLLTEQGADEDGNQFGDEYLAELDHIEVVEKSKEGYESDVPEFSMEQDSDAESKKEDNESVDTLSASDCEINICAESDSDFESSDLRNTASSTYATRSRQRADRRNNSDVSTPPASVSSFNTNEDSSSNNEMTGNTAKELPDISTSLDTYPLVPRPLSPASAAFVEKTEFSRSPKIPENGSVARVVAKKSVSMKHPMTSLVPSSTKPSKYKTIRSYYGEDTLYIMDAKSKGNIGRYLNHSCVPNVFVQNVFVDTHDLRFPAVAFFAQNCINAGTELTWDYNYEVGSVTNKVMYCYCDARTCRGRLL